MLNRPVIRPKPIPFADPVHPPTHSSSAKPAPTLPATTVARRSPVQVRVPHSTHPVTAKFMGHGALSVQSTATGRTYRFQGKGDSLQIDHRDALMLGRIPDLMVG